MTKPLDTSPCYIPYRNKWRVIINGVPEYYDEYLTALKKWQENV